MSEVGDEESTTHCVSGVSAPSRNNIEGEAILRTGAELQYTQFDCDDGSSSTN